MIIEATILCIILAVVIGSELSMWKHIKNIRWKIDKMFEGKSPEDIYNFINKKADVENTEEGVGDVEDEQ